MGTDAHRSIVLKKNVGKMYSEATRVHIVHQSRKQCYRVPARVLFKAIMDLLECRPYVSFIVGSLLPAGFLSLHFKAFSSAQNDRLVVTCR